MAWTGVLRPRSRNVQDYAAAKSREVLRRIPDGVYEAWDYMDDDLVTASRRDTACA